jgi:hypothetical protein
MQSSSSLSFGVYDGKCLAVHDHLGGQTKQAGQDSSQGILAYWASTRAPPRGAMKNILKFLFFFLKIFFSCFMHVSLSLQNMQKCIAIHFCFPFIEGKCLFFTLH